MAYPPPPPRRPIGIAILAILIILVGIILTIIFLLLLVASIALIPVLGFIAVAITGVLFILSLILLLAGFGLWNLRPWAWWLAMLVLLLEIVSQISEQDIPFLTGEAAFSAGFHAQSGFIVTKLLNFGPTTVIVQALETAF